MYDPLMIYRRCGDDDGEIDGSGSRPVPRLQVLGEAGLRAGVLLDHLAERRAGKRHMLCVLRRFSQARASPASPPRRDAALGGMAPLGARRQT